MWPDLWLPLLALIASFVAWRLRNWTARRIAATPPVTTAAVPTTAPPVRAMPVAVAPPPLSEVAVRPSIPMRRRVPVLTRRTARTAVVLSTVVGRCRGLRPVEHDDEWPR